MEDIVHNVTFTILTMGPEVQNESVDSLVNS